MSEDKKMAAAIAAVMSYLQDEEAVCAQAAMAAMPQAQVAAVSAADIIKPWAMSGRQAQMQMRTLMQMRTFHRNGSF